MELSEFVGWYLVLSVSLVVSSIPIGIFVCIIRAFWQAGSRDDTKEKVDA